MSEDDIQGYLESEDAFTQSAASAWDGSREELGDKSGTPTSLTVDVNYTLAQNMEKAAMNTVMGLGTVFVILVFLIFVISLFKYIPGLVEGKKKESKPAPAAAAPAPVAAPVAEPAVEDVTDDGELIAVIAAAIAASEGKTSTDGLVVRSIRKVNRRKR